MFGSDSTGSSLDKINQFNQIQSAYHSPHSTETALLKIFNDMYENIKAKSLTAIDALDI